MQRMHIAKMIQCQTPSGAKIAVNICITDSAWGKCNDDTQKGVQHILDNEPIQLLAQGGKGNGIKYEGSYWVFHTQTKQRLATTENVNWDSLPLQGLTFDKVYNH
jgi:hypothetical protein